MKSIIPHFLFYNPATFSLACFTHMYHLQVHKIKICCVSPFEPCIWKKSTYTIMAQTHYIFTRIFDFEILRIFAHPLIVVNTAYMFG